MLLEKDGQRWKAYSGISMSLRLARILGFRKALRVLNSMQSASNLDANSGRREFIKQFGGTLASVTGLAMLPKFSQDTHDPSWALISVNDTPETQKLLDLVHDSSEYKTYHSRIVIDTPPKIMQLEDVTIIDCLLYPDKTERDRSRVLSSLLSFFIVKQDIVGVMLTSPDYSKQEWNVVDLRNLSDKSDKSVPMNRETIVIIEKDNEPKEIKGPCYWVCTNTVHHPGHWNVGCLNGCSVACIAVCAAKPWLCGACHGACRAGCWVGDWWECTSWEWDCTGPQ